MSSGKTKHPRGEVQPGVTVLRGQRDKRLRVGAKVEILQHKHLNCAATGHVVSIDGAYNYVLPDDRELSPLAPLDGVCELYPGELKVVATYSHSDFADGVVVRIKGVDFGKSKPRSHGIVCGVAADFVVVQPVGARRGTFLALSPDCLQVERNDEQLAPAALATQVAVLAIVGALGGSTSLASLKSLLATQAGIDDVDANLARLANDGKIALSESTVALSNAHTNLVPDAVSAELLAAVETVARANERLVEAVHQAISQTSQD